MQAFFSFFSNFFIFYPKGTIYIEREESQMKIYLIRHGETDWNHVCRFQGREDIPLNGGGISQAQAAGQALRNTGITAVFTSPLQRAVRTGTEIALQIGLTTSDVHPLQNLIERDLGPFSGKLVKDSKEFFAVAAGTNVPGMEPFPSVLSRMETALTELESSGHTCVAAVSHGAAINVLLAGLSNHELGTGKTKLYNGGISLIEGNSSDGFHITICNSKPEDFPEIMNCLK